ncbi:hypothetical protein GGI07_000144 [Coemansia sp. Benny D115]|nr:hypothetical protein GGI07_000144 [Coemansia sp. Benny D115]
MALNAVMLRQGTRHPIPLPKENFLYHCSGVSFELRSTHEGDYPGSNVAPKCSSGTAFVSNKRIVYLPASSTHETSSSSNCAPGTLNSFTVAHANLSDEKFLQPIFGANAFEALVHPVAGGGVRMGSVLVLKFKEGGGFDFAATARKIKERTRETGEEPEHEEELPGYEPSASPPANNNPDVARSTGSGAAAGQQQSTDDMGPPAYPTDAPPGYEQ